LQSCHPSPLRPLFFLTNCPPEPGIFPPPITPGQRVGISWILSLSKPLLASSMMGAYEFFSKKALSLSFPRLSCYQGHIFLHSLVLSTQISATKNVALPFPSNRNRPPQSPQTFPFFFPLGHLLFRTVPLARTDFLV